MPRPDETLLKNSQTPLTSWESNLPLNKFDILGFSLQYEMNFSTVINMLKLAAIPCLAAERDDSFPLIIGGGPCVLNPEPLADFFDLFIIGDAEEVIFSLLDTYDRLKKLRLPKKDILSALSEIKGVYIPSLFEIKYSPEEKIEKIIPLKKGYEKVERIILPELPPLDNRYLVPFTQLVHDRVALEIDRGCTQGCRFCQAGYIYRPVRERKNQEIINTLEGSLRQTGYEDFSLVSLSTGDHYNLHLLIKTLMDEFADSKIAVSLPSLRPSTLTPEIISQIKRVRKTGFTIVPEAGTQRLRNVINKILTEEEILKTVSDIAQAGWKTLKLYFMIGLPTETAEDLQGIVDLCLKIARTAKSIKGNQLKTINVAVSSFIPKPHTPFQWCAQISLAEIYEKQEFLRKNFAQERMLSLKWHERELSFVEGVIARGDRRIGKVLLKAVELGCNLDAWSEFYDYRKWKKAFEETGVDPNFYVHRQIDFNEILPWDHLDNGVRKEFLIKEYSRAMNQETTPDCRYYQCNLCGWENKDGKPCPMLSRKKSGVEEQLTVSLSKEYKPIHSVQYRLRLRFEKTGPMKYISHLELGRVVHRAFRRKNVPIAYTQGFHPHPKIAFGFPLPIGMESLAEYVDVFLMELLGIPEFFSKINPTLPEGLKFLSGEYISPAAPSINVALESETFVWEPGDLIPEESLLLSILEKKEIHFSHKEKKINLRPYLLGLRITDDGLELVLKRENEGPYLKPSEVITHLLQLPSFDQVYPLRKTDCRIKI